MTETYQDTRPVLIDCLSCIFTAKRFANIGREVCSWPLPNKDIILRPIAAASETIERNMSLKSNAYRFTLRHRYTFQNWIPLLLVAVSLS